MRGSRLLAVASKLAPTKYISWIFAQKWSALFLGGLALLIGGAALQHWRNGFFAAASVQALPVNASGGYRTLAADYFWLETNLAWERKDAAKVRRLLDCTVRADPQTIYFWLNGARMLAYDFPAWQSERATLAPLAVHAHWRADGAGEALRLLERGQKWHGHSAALYLEMANICLYALRDRPRAAVYYRQAAEQTDAPDYAARIFARLQAEEDAGMTLTR